MYSFIATTIHALLFPKKLNCQKTPYIAKTKEVREKLLDTSLYPDPHSADQPTKGHRET